MIRSFIFAAVLLASSFLYAQDEAPFVYDAEGMRDPFMALVTKDGKLNVVYGTINSINDIKLEGIIYDPNGDSIVILNDEVLKKDQSSNNITILDIQRNNVKISLYNKEYTLEMKE